MSDNFTKFNPSEKQRSLLNAFKDADYVVTVTKACEVVGLARRTYYDWIDNPDFAEWWENQAKRYIALKLPQVWGNLAQAATGKFANGERPNVYAIKTFLERFDRDYKLKKKEEDNSQESLASLFLKAVREKKNMT